MITGNLVPGVSSVCGAKLKIGLELVLILNSIADSASERRGGSLLKTHRVFACFCADLSFVG
jgi:hypothetical protein